MSGFTLKGADVMEAAGTGVVTGLLAYFVVTPGQTNEAMMVAGVAVIACWFSKMMTPKFFSS